MDETDKKKPLKLDWDKLLPSQESEEPPPVIVVTTTTDSGKQREQRQKQSSAMISESSREDLELLEDRQICEQIKRKTRTLETVGPNLNDKGEKIRVAIKRLEEERERRKLRRVGEVNNICEKPTQCNSSDFNGASYGARQEAPSSEAHTQSSFASHFTKRMEDIDGRTADAFNKEISLLGRCDRRKPKLNGQSSSKRRKKSKKRPFECPNSLSVDKDLHNLSDGDQKAKTSSICSLSQFGESLSSCLAKKRDASRFLFSNDVRARKGQTVVLVDEEEPPVMETTQQAEKLAECLKGKKIYYPSRDDVESVEICYSDIQCLAPEAFLTSTIMNFYIRHLQQLAFSTDRAKRDYHFFNTYFYKKLKEAVSYKGSDKETFFMKFRRWWKGVNIFQKAYIFIPIHEDLHWSLVIICISDKEDESGPIILHLDSLGFHNSRIIFNNIRSYIREEWNYMNQEVAPPEVPIAERIWKHLPRRIEDKSIGVPQQRNDYDCGLFVLYFMQRFIEEAPERLKKKDLAMFGKQWFKSEEASDLRGKIRRLLQKEFIMQCKDS